MGRGSVLTEHLPEDLAIVQILQRMDRMLDAEGVDL